MTNIDKTMNPNEIGEAITQETEAPAEQPEVVEETPEAEVEEVEAEAPAEEPEAPSIDELNKKIATLEAQKNHFREKASKREALETSTRADMSPADLVAVMNAGVHQDDMERVERFAISEGISIRDAVAHPELKAMLDVRNEQRNTAVATNVENVRRGASKVSADTLMQRANKGDIPSGDDEIEALVAAKAKFKN